MRMPRTYLGYILWIPSTLLLPHDPAHSVAGRAGVTNSEGDIRNRQHGSDIPAGRDMTLRALRQLRAGRDRP